MTSCLKRLILLIATAVVCLQPARAGAQAIAVEGDHFTIDRADGAGPHPKFLLFISYFDALRATDLNGDLDYLANTLHFDGVRVFPNWERRDANYCPEQTTDRLFDAAGNIRGDTTPATGPLKTLLDLIEAARARHLVVDVTFSRDTVPGLSWDDHIRAVTRMATLLRPYRNVLFDLDNEVQNHASPDATIRQLRDAILANADPAVGDPGRIIVVSRSGPTDGVVAYNQAMGTSAVAYHDERDPGWETRVPAVVAALRPSGTPAYLQEPIAWNSNLNICGDDEPAPKSADGDVAHFRTAVANARAAGAAAWTFHTRQSFRLHVGGSLRSWIQENPDEKGLLEGTTTQPSLSTVAATGPWPIDTRLTVTVSGTGDGSVTSSPAGIDCGGTGQSCTATFPPGTAVTLTASSQTGSEFQGWVGCSGSPSCTVTLDESKSVTAQFAAVQRVFYYDLDAIGSVRMVTDTHGAPVERHDYTPFGVEFPTAASFSPRLFAGKEHDGESGFDYFGGRYLSADAGRFTTIDPVVDSSSALFEPQGWGRYSYVKNNPLRFVDPDGRNPLMIAAAVAGLIYLHEARLNAPGPGQQLVNDRGIGDLLWDAAVNATTDGIGAGVQMLGRSLFTRAMASVVKSGGAEVERTGFRSFTAFKRAMGRAGDGIDWHHVVEQTSANLTTFGEEQVHNVANLMRLNRGTHKEISRYYSSKQAFTGGKTFREWLKGKSFEEQKRWGEMVLETVAGIVK